MPNLSEQKNLDLPFPLVSVLVAAWNEAYGIEIFLNSFLNLDYPNKELVLVAGGEDRTFAIASSWNTPKVTVLEQQKGEGKFLSLKRGLPFTKGTIIYLTDADCRLTTKAFLEVITPIRKDQESVVTGRFCPLHRQLSIPFVYAQWQQIAFHKKQAKKDTYVHSLTGANSAIKRVLLEECWQSTLEQPIGEDHYLALWVRRSGYQIYEARKSYIETEFPETMGAYIRQRARWLRSWLLLDYFFGERHWHQRLSIILKGYVILALSILTLLSWAFLNYQLGLIISFICIFCWGYYFITYAKIKYGIRKKNQEDLYKLSFSSLIQLMVADLCSRIIALLYIVVRRWRGIW